MKMRNQIISSMILAVIVLLAPVMAMAQFPPFDPGGNPDVPIDGGLSVLLAAGAGYVVKKGYDRKKRKEKERGEENSN